MSKEIWTLDILKQKVTCKKCLTVGFAVSKKYAENESKRFEEYYNTLDDEGKSNYGNDGRPYHYKCMLCGKSDFRLSTDEEIDKIYGCTISPVVWEPK